jgi:hypothetical protein
MNAYRNKLKRHLIDPLETTVCTDKVNIFTESVKLIFFWKSQKDNCFFEIFEYLDKFICIQDSSGYIYNLWNEEIDNECIYDIIKYIFNKICIYNDLCEIKFSKLENQDLTKDFLSFYNEYTTNTQ